MGSPPRRTERAADNEDRDALETTLRGIAENVSSWGESGREKKLPRFLPGRCSDRLGVEYAVHWSEVLVVIISDGVIYQGAGADANFQVPSSSTLDLLQARRSAVRKRAL